MPRPLTRAQAAQNHAFLRELGRHGNVREACRTLGIHRATLTKRRAKHPAFAAAWEAALAAAQAHLAAEATEPARTQDPNGEGEPRLIRRHDGTLQRRRVPPGPIDRAAERRFLSTLRATASMRRSAEAAGFTHSAFHQRARANPAFAREVTQALTEGYDPRDLALIAGLLPEDYADDGWRPDDPGDDPLITPEQALRRLFANRNRVELPPRPGDPTGDPLVLDATDLAREQAERRQRWVESIVMKLARAAKRECLSPPATPPTPPTRD